MKPPASKPDMGKGKHGALSWFRDDFFRRMFKNAGILTSGYVGTAILDLGSLALTARALGPEFFGILVLIQTYARVVDNLVNFQSWEALIKYGADKITQGRSEEFKQLIKIGTLLDLGTALLATVIAAAGIWFLAGWREWDGAVTQLALIYCITILFHLIGTPTAVLRLYDRFTWLASLKLSMAAIRLIVVTIAWYAGGGIWSFVLIWGVMQVMESLLLLWLGWHQLSRAGYSNTLGTRVVSPRATFPGLVRFVVSTNLISSVKLGKQELDILLVGIVLSPAAVGIYKIAKQFGTIASRFLDPLQQSIYPDLAKLWARGAIPQFRNSIIRIGLLAGAFSLLVLFGGALVGRPALSFLLGAEYLAVYLPMLAIMAGLVFFALGIASRPTLLTLGRADSILVIEGLISVLFLGLLWVLMQKLGLLGAALAHLVTQGIWLGLMVVFIGRALRNATVSREPEEAQ